MVQRYNILGRYTNQCLCLCSHAWPVEVSHGKIRVRRDFHIFRTVAGKKLTNSEVTDLILKGQTRELSGFKGKDGKSFKAKLKRDDKGSVCFVFSQKKSN